MLSTADDMTGGISSHRAEEKKQTRQRKREKERKGQ